MDNIFVKARFTGSRGEEIIDALVDMSTTYTVIPRHLTDEIDAPLTVIYTDVKTANGVVGLEFTYITVEIEGAGMLEAAPISNGLEMPLIGVRTLEGLGYRIDSTTGRLEKMGIYLL